MMYVADANCFFWYLNETLPRRSKRAFEVMEAADSGNAIVALPVIVLLELQWILARKKDPLPHTYSEILSFCASSNRYEIVPLDLALLQEVDRIGMKMEMHDTIIVATATVLDAPVVTNDPAIHSSGLVETVW